MHTPSKLGRVLIIQNNSIDRCWWEALIKSLDQNAVIHLAASAEGLQLTPLEDHPRSRPEPCLSCYDLVIADSTLNGRAAGLDLWEIGNRFCPGIRFLLVAQEQTPTTAHARLKYLQKPLAAKQAREAIHNLLAS